IVGAGTTGTQKVSFEDLSPVLDLVSAAVLTINATPSANAINYSVGALVGQGKVTIDDQEAITFSNKTALTINAGAGTDSIGVNNSLTPTGLTAITIDGGDPNGGNSLNVTGVGAAVGVVTGTGTITGATGAAGAVSITYSNIQALNLLSGIGNLTLTT